MGGHIKVADFGMALATDARQYDETRMGTPMYMAPELANQRVTVRACPPNARRPTRRSKKGLRCVESHHDTFVDVSFRGGSSFLLRACDNLCRAPIGRFRLMSWIAPRRAGALERSELNRCFFPPVVFVAISASRVLYGVDLSASAAAVAAVGDSTTTIATTCTTNHHPQHHHQDHQHHQ